MIESIIPVRNQKRKDKRKLRIIVEGSIVKFRANRLRILEAMWHIVLLYFIDIGITVGILASSRSLISSDADNIILSQIAEAAGYATAVNAACNYLRDIWFPNSRQLYGLFHGILVTEDPNTAIIAASEGKEKEIFALRRLCRAFSSENSSGIGMPEKSIGMNLRAGIKLNTLDLKCVAGVPDAPQSGESLVITSLGNIRLRNRHKRAMRRWNRAGYVVFESDSNARIENMVNN